MSNLHDNYDLKIIPKILIPYLMTDFFSLQGKRLEEDCKAWWHLCFEVVLIHNFVMIIIETSELGRHRQWKL